MMLNKWINIKETKETFIDFNKDNAENSSITRYIPQYSLDTQKTVIHLYDNLYFDDKNGVVIEAEGTQSGTTDTSGNSINQLHIIPRDGQSYRSVQGRTVNNIAQPNDTVESKITTTNAMYDEYTYTTRTLIMAGSIRYQIFYYSWNTQTFIHLFKYSITETAAVGATPLIPAYKLQYVKSYMMNPTDGLKYTITATPSFDTIPSPNNRNTDFIYDDANNKNNAFLPGYLNGTVKVFQITPLVFYDIANGNIILKNSGTDITVYDRSGSLKPNPANTGNPTQLSGQPTIFTIASDKSGMVLVTSFYQNTIISVIIVDNANSAHAYKIAATQRFNKTQAVNDLSSDPDNAAPTSGPTTAAATTPPGGWNEWNKIFNEKWNDKYDDIMNCGSDKSCWYWFFKSLPNLKDDNQLYDNNGQSFFSDDYFLKTEAVPPVCPQCPNCPTSGTGTCTSCGGNGGSGTTLSSCSSVDLHLTPIVSTKYTDNLGNIYIATTDNSGNKNYRLEGKMTTGGSASTGGTTSTNTGTSVGSLDNNISGVANNAINTAGGVVGTAGNLAFSAGSGAVNLLKDTGSGAVDLLKDTGSGAVDLLKDTGSGAINLLKDAGNGIANLGSGSLKMQGSQYNSVGVGGVGPSQLGSVSDKTFGKMSGQTPVDNYSYYGALQSKGGNFMPVTADFSSFRK